MGRATDSGYAQSPVIRRLWPDLPGKPGGTRGPIYPHVACGPTSVFAFPAGFPFLFALYPALYLLFFFLLLSFLCFSIVFLRHRFRLSSGRLSSLVFLRRFTLLLSSLGLPGSPGLPGQTPAKKSSLFSISFFIDF